MPVRAIRPRTDRPPSSGSCHLLLPYYLASPLGGMTLHIVWHIGAGIGAHMMCVLLTVLRLVHSLPTHTPTHPPTHTQTHPTFPPLSSNLP